MLLENGPKVTAGGKTQIGGDGGDGKLGGGEKGLSQPQPLFQNKSVEGTVKLLFEQGVEIIEGKSHRVCHILLGKPLGEVAFHILIGTAQHGVAVKGLPFPDQRAERQSGGENGAVNVIQIFGFHNVQGPVLEDVVECAGGELEQIAVVQKIPKTIQACICRNWRESFNGPSSERVPPG